MVLTSKYVGRIRAGALAFGAAIALAGCQANDDKDRLAFDGFYFKAKSAKIDDTLSGFTVAVFDASRSLVGARQAAAYEGVRYCIALDGTSRIRWQVGPNTPDDQLALVDDTVIFQGECNP